MLNNEHFFNPTFKITNLIKKKKPSIVKVYDKLFYTIYHKLNESNMFFNKYNEKIEKIKVIELLSLRQFKQKNKILEDLQNSNIQLFTLNALCELWNINITWFSSNCYYEFIVNPNKEVYYLSDTLEWKNKPETMKYKIVDIFKPLKSISYYKLDELKEMSSYMNINGKTKKDLYDQIVEYFKHIKLI